MEQGEIDTIIYSLINGNFSQAKRFTQYRCKTLPERQAYRVGRVIGALCDPDGYRHMPDLAVIYLNLFKGV